MTTRTQAAAPERRAIGCEFKFVAGGEPGTFDGYGSVFNNEDDYGDVILPGAFAPVLARHQAKNSMPKMLINHGSMGGGLFGGSDPMADLPIGKWLSMSEDSHGLQVKGKLINLDTEHGKRIYGAMKEGELGGLSIGYRAGDFTRGTKPNEPRRTIKTMKELFEVSPVTFPANELATIGAVKGAGMTEREFERLLTRDAGLSRSEALVVMNRGFKALLATRDAGKTGFAGVLDHLRSVRRLINS
jgi:HK97 family phage prohead protease